MYLNPCGVSVGCLGNATVPSEVIYLQMDIMSLTSDSSI